MFKITKVIVSIFIVTISIVSCKKEVNGCTDATADNYNVEANKDNGSCNYHGYLVPWYDTITRDSLLSNNVASVGVYVDNEVFQNFYPTFIMWSFEPECSTTTIGNWISMQGTKNRSISVTVKALDSSNVEVRNWVQTLTVQSDECELHQIIW
jgi:hypothetical protein